MTWITEETVVTLSDSKYLQIYYQDEPPAVVIEDDSGRRIVLTSLYFRAMEKYGLKLVDVLHACCVPYERPIPWPPPERHQHESWLVRNKLITDYAPTINPYFPGDAEQFVFGEYHRVYEWAKS